jgi:hypothetical protein
MSDDLEARMNNLESHMEKTVSQLTQMVGFMGALSTAVSQLTNTWVEETTALKRDFNGHSQGFEQLMKAQTQIASAADSLSRQCAAMFKLQNERIAAIEASKQRPETQQLN